MPTSTVLEERWRALVQALRAEFWRAGQDPNEALFTLGEIRLLRGRLTDPPAEAEWFSVPVTARELEGGDVEALAREFYRRYRAARDRRGG